MQENNYCVYKHTSPSNKIYIGITSQKVEARWRKGKSYLGNKHFANAINKYGWDNFKHEIIFENLSKEEACQKEIELIAFYKSNQSEFGYNQSTGGEGGTTGYCFSPEHCRKLSESHKGNNFKLGKHPSPESCQKMSDSKKGSKNPNYGKHRPTKTCQKISEANKITQAKKADAYKKYKANGGTLTWGEFQGIYKINK